MTADERIDLDLVRGELASFRFAETELREETWSPLLWVYLVGGGLHPLLARDFAPLAVRLASVAGRLEGIPALLDQARAVIGTHPTRPVAKLHAEVAAQRIGGVARLARDAVARAEAAAPTDPDVAALLPRLRAAADEAAAALEAMAGHLAQEVVPNVSGPAELGEPLFSAKLRHTLQDPDATADGRAGEGRGRVRRRAGRDGPDRPRDLAGMAARRARAGRRGRAGPGHARRDRRGPPCGGRSRGVLPRGARAGRGVLPGARRDRPRGRAAPDRLDAGVHALVRRGDAGLAGPARRRPDVVLLDHPVREEWTPDEVESYLREENARQLRLLTIHEAVPGHYLQMAYANRGSSLARRVFRSGLFAEGWAVYVTQVMLDRGYGDGDLALWLVHWKFYLRAVVNTILDVRIHTMGMTSEEAISLMVDGAFQERAEALAKDERARLTSTQLVDVLPGLCGMWEIEDAARRRAAVAAGAAEDAVPAPRVVGGYPATPGFDERAHLEAVIAHGAPPIPILRRILLGEG